MSLTGSVFLTLVVLATLASFAAAVVLWPRLGGPRPAQIAGRVAMLVGVNLLVLLTAATQLNAQFLFFADWTDLWGALGGASTTTAQHRGATAARAASAPIAGAAGADAEPALPQLPAGAAQPSGLLRYLIKGPRSGIAGEVLVQLPPGYTDRAAASRRYPVLETFQGYPGNPLAWIGPMNLGGVMAEKVAKHRMAQALIVSPDVQIPTGIDTECVNGAAGYPQLETWVAEDVPAWVVRHFRVRTDRSSWATIGLSSGGWCAAMAAMLHPAQYGAAIVMGGYFRPEFGPFFEPYPPNSPLAVRYDLVRLVKRRPPPLAMWVETSHSDPVSYATSSALLAAAREPLSVQAIVLQHAGHRVGLWQGLLPGALDWLGASAPGFAYKR